MTQDMGAYAETYTTHVRNHPDPNVAIGGGDEIAIGVAQAQQLFEAGVLPAQRMLEVGFGTGRIWHGIPTLMDVSTCTYFGIDVVEDLVPAAKGMLQRAGVPEDQTHLEIIRNTSEYPVGYDADAVWGYSVFTHLDMEDVYTVLRGLLPCTRPTGKALFTYLPLEHAFGRQNFTEEAQTAIPNRYMKIRNVAVTRSMAEEVAGLAGWTVLDASWAEHVRPLDSQGRAQAHQSWLLLTPA